MKKSYSRIRHTQETNMLLENRFLSERKNRLFEQVTNNTTKVVSPENAYQELLNLNVPLKGTRYQDELRFGNLTIKPINFFLLSKSEEPVELSSVNTTVGKIYQVKYNSNIIINFTSDKQQPYIPDTKFIDGSSKKENITQQSPTTNNGTIGKLENGKKTFSYYKITKDTNTLVYSHGGVGNDVNTTVIINNWDFKSSSTGQMDNNPQFVYVEKIEGNKVTLKNSNGTVVVIVK